MNFGFVMPYGDARTAAHMARDAEQAGWDGFFVWEPVWGIDAWVCLTAAAMQTERIKLGTMLTPLSRMRPWKLASETATLDNLSGGRVILTVGLGAIDSGFAAFGEVTDRKLRAELLDEGLAILTGLWQGQPFAFSGKHYQVEPLDWLPVPPPVQQPRIPIWCVGAAGKPKTLRRVANLDGLIPSGFGEDGVARQATPDELRAMLNEIESLRVLATPLDIIVEGETPGEDMVAATEQIQPWIDAGATWWLEAPWSHGGPEGIEAVRQRIHQGPPTH